MECVRRIGETRGPVTAGLGFVEMRVEHDLRAVPDGPADRFRIAPALVADRDAECQRTGLENAPPGTGRIDAFLGRIDLDLVLEAGDRSVLIDHQRGGEQRAVDHAFGAENNREVGLRGGRCEADQARSRNAGSGGGTAFPASVPGDEAFRKADDAGAFEGA